MSKVRIADHQYYDNEYQSLDLARWIIDFEFNDPKNRNSSQVELAEIYASKIEAYVNERIENEKEKVCYKCYRPVALLDGWHGNCPTHGKRSEHQVVWLTPKQIKQLTKGEPVYHAIDFAYKQDPSILPKKNTGGATNE